MENVAAYNNGLAQYRAKQDALRRRLRLQHTTAAIGITLTSLALALRVGPGVGIRAFVGLVFIYAVVTIVAGLIGQWMREYDLDN